MQTLYLRAENNVIDKIMEIVNQFSQKGENIEVLDSFLFNSEKKMIHKSLSQEKKGETIEHDELWDELLK